MKNAGQLPDIREGSKAMARQPLAFTDSDMLSSEGFVQARVPINTRSSTLKIRQVSQAGLCMNNSSQRDRFDVQMLQRVWTTALAAVRLCLYGLIPVPGLMYNGTSCKVVQVIFSCTRPVLIPAHGVGAQ
eukprot:363132-Chlamydomonas_euryale.AAC.16